MDTTAETVESNVEMEQINAEAEHQDSVDKNIEMKEIIGALRLDIEDDEFDSNINVIQSLESIHELHLINVTEKLAEIVVDQQDGLIAEIEQIIEESSGDFENSMNVESIDKASKIETILPLIPDTDDNCYSSADMNSNDQNVLLIDNVNPIMQLNDPSNANNIQVEPNTISPKLENISDLCNNTFISDITTTLQQQLNDNKVENKNDFPNETGVEDHIQENVKSNIANPIYLNANKTIDLKKMMEDVDESPDLPESSMALHSTIIIDNGNQPINSSADILEGISTMNNDIVQSDDVAVTIQKSTDAAAITDHVDMIYNNIRTPDCIDVNDHTSKIANFFESPINRNVEKITLIRSIENEMRSKIVILDKNNKDVVEIEEENINKALIDNSVDMANSDMPNNLYNNMREINDEQEKNIASGSLLEIGKETSTRHEILKINNNKPLDENNLMNENTAPNKIVKKTIFIISDEIITLSDSDSEENICKKQNDELKDINETNNIDEELQIIEAEALNKVPIASQLDQELAVVATEQPQSREKQQETSLQSEENHQSVILLDSDDEKEQNAFCMPSPSDSFESDRRMTLADVINSPPRPLSPPPTKQPLTMISQKEEHQLVTDDIIMLSDSDDEDISTKMNNIPSENTNFVDINNKDVESQPVTEVVARSTELLKTNTLETFATSIQDQNKFSVYECVNSLCKRKSNEFICCPLFVLNYFDVFKKKSTQYVCEDCFDEALVAYSQNTDMLLKQETLFDNPFIERPVVLDICDSDDDNDLDDGACGNETMDENSMITQYGKQILSKDVLNTIEHELESVMSETFEKINIKSQIDKSINVITHKLNVNERMGNALNDNLNKVQKIADNMFYKLSYIMSRSVRIKTLTPYDANTNKPYQMSTTNSQSIAKREITVHDILYPKLNTQDMYYAVRLKLLSSWTPCHIQEELDSAMMSKKTYKVKFLRQQGMLYNYLLGNKIAYGHPPRVKVKVGTRVIALNTDPSTPNARPAFFPGVIAEALNCFNNYRYLVFYDDGYVSYVSHNNIRVVCEQNDLVWEDVHMHSRKFIKEYLTQFTQARPMIQTTLGQRLMVEYENKWLTGVVRQIDASLVKIFFEDVNKLEWIYRGSKRFSLLFKQNNNYPNSMIKYIKRSDAELLQLRPSLTMDNILVEEEKGKIIELKKQLAKQQPLQQPKEPVQQRRELQSNKSPVFVIPKPQVQQGQLPNRASILPQKYQQDQQRIIQQQQFPQQKKIQQQLLQSPQQQQQQLQQQRHQRRLNSIQQQPQRLQYGSLSHNPQHSLPHPQHFPEVRRAVARKSTVNVPSTFNTRKSYDQIDVQPKGKVVYYTAKKHVPPKKYQSHTCNPNCLYKITHDLSGYNLLAKPLLSGWDRIITITKYNRNIIYRAPCGRRLYTMGQLYTYLRTTNCSLNVDSFDFDSTLNCLAEYIVENCFYEDADISNGLENMPVQCVNCYNDEEPPPIVYSAKRIPNEGVPLNLDPEFLCGCDCTDDCMDKSKCQCWQLTLQHVKKNNPNRAVNSIGYVYKRLHESVTTGIYECNIRCKCNQNCLNRVVQHPLLTKLQVFKTTDRGWGLRCLNDIPKGSFVCVYAGDLLTETNANEFGDNYGDEYFAELDYIEVVENIKEGYESDVRDTYDDDEDSDKSETNGTYNKRRRNSDDDEFVSKTVIDTERCVKTRYQTRHTIDEPFNNNTINSNDNNDTSVKTNASHSGSDTYIISDDDEERAPMNFEPKDSMRAYGDGTSRRKSIRKYFGKDEQVYIMDAKKSGNVGRYFNHSCSPNLYVQNVFVDTHDLRFPWVAFFSLNKIRAGSELTWNYNYDVDSVPGKKIFCKCNAENCRGRLL